MLPLHLYRVADVLLQPAADGHEQAELSLVFHKAGITDPGIVRRDIFPAKKDSQMSFLPEIFPDFGGVDA